MNKKIFQVVDKIITTLETDKFSLIILITILTGMILVAIGLSTTKASYTPHTVKNTKQVWGYTWGNKAFELQKKLINIWYTDYQSKLIINKCKKFRTTWVVDCIIAIASIWKSESWAFKHCYRWQCMGVKKFWFKNLSANLNDWLIRYNKYWYKWRRKGWARFFYSINWKPSLSRYCTEEASSWYKKYNCINGYKHFQNVFYYLIK